MGIRLNKFLASCGLGSRRKVEEFIQAGRIRINGKTVHKQGIIIETKDIVELDKNIVCPLNQFHYIILNKPKGYITTTNDEKGRPIVMDIIPEKFKRAGVYPVGRLDKDTEGLLLFTNDGELAYKLTKPDFKLPKEYVAEIDRPLAQSDKKIIEKGIYLHQIKTKTKPAIVEILDKSNRFIKIIIREGKNRQIRFTFLNLGYKVKKLKRTAFGSLTLKGINRGSYRALNKKDIKSLKGLVSA